MFQVICSMPYLKKGTDSATGQNVGMLTRIDPLVCIGQKKNTVFNKVSKYKL